MMATSHMTEIIAVASSKGGVGKTTTSFSLAAAAGQRGSVIVIDLDPSISLTTQMQVPITGPTIEDVLKRTATLEDALVQTKEGILMVPGSREMYHLEVTEDLLREVFGPVMDLADTLILDTRPALEALEAPMRFASRVVIPTYLDGVSMPVTADTIHLALEAGLPDRVSGVLASNVRRPLTVMARDLYASLQMSGVGLEAVVWNTVQWPTALASGGLGGFPELMEAATVVYDEVRSRTSPEFALRMYADAWRKVS
ncbi:MAG: chromosome partitioning protein [Chloroflexota bacterium]|jgi:MinD-like ATPase involved in chromosome partitioning or flagellar assembly|nr:chromosome partitioning protein [Chloroflexota bacterium]